MFGGGAPARADEELWQDREIRFDSHPSTLDLRSGEIEIDQINSVEDTKGNNGAYRMLYQNQVLPACHWAPCPVRCRRARHAHGDKPSHYLELAQELPYKPEQCAECGAPC